MKTTQTTSVSKLVNRFDKELKALLMSDLKAMRAVKDKITALDAARLNAA